MFGLVIDLGSGYRCKFYLIPDLRRLVVCVVEKTCSCVFIITFVCAKYDAKGRNILRVELRG